MLHFHHLSYTSSLRCSYFTTFTTTFFPRVEPLNHDAAKDVCVRDFLCDNLDLDER